MKKNRHGKILNKLCGNRPVGSGTAWRRSPHQKSAGRKREKEEKERMRGEGRRKEEKKDRKGDGMKSERCIVGVKHKHPLGFVKKI